MPVEMSYDEWIAAGQSERMDAGEPQAIEKPPARTREFPDRESIVAVLKEYVAEHGSPPGSKDPFGKKLRNAAFTLKPSVRWSEICQAAGVSSAGQPRKQQRKKQLSRPKPNPTPARFSELAREVELAAQAVSEAIDRQNRARAALLAHPLGADLTR